MHRRVRVDPVGFWTATTTALLAVISLGLAVTTPPRSGPFCRSACIGPPYTDAADFVPRDYLWMYPTLLYLLALVALTALLQDRCSPDRRWLSNLGLCFTGMAVTPLVLAYGIQLTVLQPNLLQAQTDGLSPWSQYHPSGLFIGLENIGYAGLGLSFVVTGMAQARGATGLRRAAGRVFTLGGAAILVLLVLLAALYRSDLAYRFEVWSILLTWLVTVSAAVLLCLDFARPAAANRH